MLTDGTKGVQVFSGLTNSDEDDGRIAVAQWQEDGVTVRVSGPNDLVEKSMQRAIKRLGRSRRKNADRL